jgi:hypothetical protein
MLFATCSFRFLASSSHVFDPQLMMYPMHGRTLVKKDYARAKSFRELLPEPVPRHPWKVNFGYLLMRRHVGDLCVQSRPSARDNSEALASAFLFKCFMNPKCMHSHSCARYPLEFLDLNLCDFKFITFSQQYNFDI